MKIIPIVRYMIVCDDWAIDPDNGMRVNIFGLATNIDSLGDPPFPLLREELCVFLSLTDGYGQGNAKIICVLEETGERAFETLEYPIPFRVDPSEVVGVPFRIRGCFFPRPGVYLIQFWYEGELVEERPIRLR